MTADQDFELEMATVARPRGNRRVLLLGGTSGTGRLVADLALSGGHVVSVFARSPAKASGLIDDGARLLVGDARDLQAVESAVAGHDVVICCLGPVGRARKTQFIGAACQALLRGMAASGVDRIVFLSALGVGESRSQAPWWFRAAVIPLFLRQAYRDKETAEGAIRATNATWTIVRPTILSDRPSKEVEIDVGGRRKLHWPVGRPDVAKLLLECAVEERHALQVVAIGRGG